MRSSATVPISSRRPQAEHACCAGGAEQLYRSHPSPATQRVLHALHENLGNEHSAHLKLVHGMSRCVLDPLQWCRAASALHPQHCNLEPHLRILASLDL